MSQCSDPVACTEENAERFYRDTHMMAPFKSQPLEMGGHPSDEERMDAWKKWCNAGNYKCASRLPTQEVEG